MPETQIIISNMPNHKTIDYWVWLLHHKEEITRANSIVWATGDKVFIIAGNRLFHCTTLTRKVHASHGPWLLQNVTRITTKGLKPCLFSRDFRHLLLISLTVNSIDQCVPMRKSQRSSFTRCYQKYRILIVQNCQRVLCREKVRVLPSIDLIENAEFKSI